MKYRNSIALIAMLVSACEQPDVPAPESEKVAPIVQPAPVAPTPSGTPVVVPPVSDPVSSMAPVVPPQQIEPDHPIGATMEAAPEEVAPEGMMEDYAPPPEDALILPEDDGMDIQEPDASEEYFEEPDHSMEAPTDETIMIEDVMPNTADMQPVPEDDTSTQEGDGTVPE